MATIFQSKGDSRFTEVEASFSLKFLSGFVTTCTTSYDVHKSQFLQVEETKACADMSPGYRVDQLKWSHLKGESESEIVPQIEEKDQFALEMDHFADCILEGKTRRLRVKKSSKITALWKQFTNRREPAEPSGFPADFISY